MDYAYYQYVRYDEGMPECERGQKAIGVRRKHPGPPSAYPDLARLEGWDEMASTWNPLRVRADGRKGWEFQLYRGAIPSIEDVDVGECEVLVCGYEDSSTPNPLIEPARILNGTGTVKATVSHEVFGADERVRPSQPSSMPKWQPQFPEVVSQAEARFTAARVNPPSPSARAELESTQ